MNTKEEKKHTIAEEFIARRIAEFPTLYHHGDEVIFSNVISTQGSCYWDTDGCLKQGDQYLNPKTKKWGKYPLKIPMETAYSLVYSHGDFFHPYYNMNGPINVMPANVEESWLMEISMFLTKWGNFSMDDFIMIATVQCMLYYGCRSNPNASLPDRTIDDFKQFHRKIPSWRAMVDSIYYQKQYNKVDPTTYQGMGI